MIANAASWIKSASKGFLLYFAILTLVVAYNITEHIMSDVSKMRQNIEEERKICNENGNYFIDRICVPKSCFNVEKEKTAN